MNTKNRITIPIHRYGIYGTTGANIVFRKLFILNCLGHKKSGTYNIAVPLSEVLALPSSLEQQHEAHAVYKSIILQGY